jgi:hypothetical protein
VNNSDEEQSVNTSISDYSEQSSALAHSLLVKLQSGDVTKINSKESLILASDLAHIWASCKMMDKQVQKFCASPSEADEQNLVEILTNIEHIYSHSLTAMSILSEMMLLNNIVSEK